MQPNWTSDHSKSFESRAAGAAARALRSALDVAVKLRRIARRDVEVVQVVLEAVQTLSRGEIEREVRATTSNLPSQVKNFPRHLSCLRQLRICAYARDLVHSLATLFRIWSTSTP